MEPPQWMEYMDNLFEISHGAGKQNQTTTAVDRAYGKGFTNTCPSYLGTPSSVNHSLWIDIDDRYKSLIQ
ncbi:hypothetical protein PanWU01x14_133620 [Parasponia andersonii]|uniref:Uncharacterized protein n=1 Tax=Parasponia andersonii TaxID=3476 RepID=A0A2P5CPW5_PARAD|nr:hypothetical protein PanWU01x14_133620 [Parasponia andersonii]